ncbi:vesicle transport protein SEC20-like [Anneissia japonica]|uniref:vesicle transport protein SEC20-like n=1 Tax=Anneissia japonica TaxID=1529436 RepID=UPI001425801A|nr:vesicle transport protein SEC20-like [Anneissia japonica]
MTTSNNSVEERMLIQEIAKHDLQISALIQDIRQNVKSVEALEDVHMRIKEELKIIKARVEDLDILVKEQDNENQKIQCQNTVDKYRKQLISTQTEIKKARLACKLRIDQNEKEELLLGGLDPELKKRKNKESRAKTASTITENLMSLNKMMQQSVEQSENTNKVLDKSSKGISKAHEEFEKLHRGIRTSGNFLTKYGRRELTDKLFMFLAVALFFGTVAYIIQKRLF